MVERSPNFKIGPIYSSFQRYTYRIEIKDNRIRATISLNEVGWPPDIVPSNIFYPFRKIMNGKKHMEKFAEYAITIIDNIKNDIKDELSDDQW